MFHFLTNVQYCYDYTVNQISLGLLLYAHIPAAVIAIIFSIFLLYKNKTTKSITLSIVCVAFAIWTFLSLSTWFSFQGSSNTMFTWSLIDLFGLIFFFFAYYFLYAFITEKDLPNLQKIIGFLFILPTVVWTFFGLNLSSYNANYCEAIENSSVTNYPYIIQAIFILAVIVLVAVNFYKIKQKYRRKEILLAGIGVFIFLLFFFTATFGVSLLVDYNIWQYAYNIEIYGLFGMPVLLVFLGFLIVRYKAFDIKMFGAQVLILSLIALIGSQFFFIQSNTNRILTAVTLVITGFIGINLMRSVKKEITQREKIERLAQDLELANSRQTSLIHFITHQIKGSFTKSKGLFSMIVEGDYGPISPELKSAASEGLSSDTKAVDMVQEILNASNLKKGTVAYAMQPFNLKDIVTEVFDSLKKDAEAKGLKFSLNCSEGSYVVKGDADQIKHVIKNLTDNSVRYTPSGSVSLNLETKKLGHENRVIFYIKDTGVGISKEDFERLFTEGGRGKDAVKVNVNSTGYGLFIAKQIVNAHGGHIWAQSDGVDKGSAFYVELGAEK